MAPPPILPPDILQITHLWGTDGDWGRGKEHDIGFTLGLAERPLFCVSRAGGHAFVLAAVAWKGQNCL